MELSSVPQEFARRKRSAQQLYEQGEAAFTAGHYKKAHTAYSTSTVWVPSYRTMVKAGDALFYRYAFSTESEGTDGGKTSCSTYFVRDAELQIPQTYDAALKFLAFETAQTGLRVSDVELAQVRHKSECLKALASAHQAPPETCVDRTRIKECLVQPD
ncbi:hypothetical protein [Archangium primigenium]|uniref:hypothetical protein n=1 Tax=[Archangium] primigenium TaxID=2792470 RepID=UPI001956DA79|nr:hypothetical protein [Archangium primigenium]MBM7112380.1 hypothetical protein [Archangium primigenium]